MVKVISEKARTTRKYWVDKIQKLSGNFIDNTERLENELAEEIKKYGSSALNRPFAFVWKYPRSI